MKMPVFSRQCKQNAGFFPCSTQLYSQRFSPLISHNKKCLLTLENAQVRIGSRLLWDKVNLALCSGEFTALLGDNGVGKTTLFKVLLTMLSLSQGKLEKSENLRIGYVPQLKMFDPKLPIRGRDLVALGLDGHEYGLGFLSKLWQRRSSHLLTPQRKHYLIDKAIDEVGGSHFAHVALNELSGGEQQRMRIAQALVAEPALLLLDEPLLSLDSTSQTIVCDILAHRKKVHQTAILMISHEILPILPLMDKVLWLNHKTAKTYLPADFFAQNDFLPLSQSQPDYSTHFFSRHNIMAQEKEPLMAESIVSQNTQTQGSMV